MVGSTVTSQESIRILIQVHYSDDSGGLLIDALDESCRTRIKSWYQVNQFLKFNSCECSKSGLSDETES